MAPIATEPGQCRGPLPGRGQSCRLRPAPLAPSFKRSLSDISGRQVRDPGPAYLRSCFKLEQLAAAGMPAALLARHGVPEHHAAHASLHQPRTTPLQVCTRFTTGEEAPTYSRPKAQLRLIQHKQEAYWFYRFLSIVYDHIVNPGHWTEDMRDDALSVAKLDSPDLKVRICRSAVTRSRCLLLWLRVSVRVC